MGEEIRVEKGVWGGISSKKDLLKIHMETQKPS